MSPSQRSTINQSLSLKIGPDGAVKVLKNTVKFGRGRTVVSITMEGIRYDLTMASAVQFLAKLEAQTWDAHQEQRRLKTIAILKQAIA